MSFQFPFNIPEAKFQELEKFILKQLRQNVDIQKELIPEIAIRMDWDWDKSKKLVDYVTEDHKKEIAHYYYIYILSIDSRNNYRCGVEQSIFGVATDGACYYADTGPLYISCSSKR